MFLSRSVWIEKKTRSREKQAQPKPNTYTMNIARAKSNAGTPIRRPPASSESIISELSTDSIMEDRYVPRSVNKATQVKAAQLLLGLACLWPLFLLLIPPQTTANNGGGIHAGIDHLRLVTSSEISRNLHTKTAFLKDEMSTLLHRTDVVGYGADQPRVSVVIVVPPHDGDGEDLQLKAAEDAVESIFRTTDRNRIFIVTVVLDGRGKLGSFESKLQDVDAGRTRHRHGGKVHSHDHHKEWGKDAQKEVHAHSEKIHILYNHEGLGVVKARKRGVQFVNILAKKHEEAGLKSSQEDLILVFLRCDALFHEEEEGERTWLDDVTDALIIKSDKDEVQQQPANAISFAVDFLSTDENGNIQLHPLHPGETQSMDFAFHPTRDMATSQQISLSNGESYPTPLLLGGATAMRLETYNSLPASDDELTNHFGADVEMSFNLWMCADGIDILSGTSLARVQVDPKVMPLSERSSLTGPLIARLVSTWMEGHGDDIYADAFLEHVAKEAAAETMSKSYIDHAKIPKDKDMVNRALQDEIKRRRDLLVRISAEAKQSTSFPSGIGKKCRPFSWFVEHVMTKLAIEEEEIEAVEVVPEISDVIQTKSQKILPSKQLGEENMAIISKASPVKLAYVDISGNHAEHPHKGAQDEKGNFGYVHDETFLVNSPPSFEFHDDSDKEKLCRKGGMCLTLFRFDIHTLSVISDFYLPYSDPNYQMLTQKVFVDLTSHEAAEKRAEHGSQQKRVKIFCLVYTIEKFHDRIPAIKETWG